MSFWPKMTPSSLFLSLFDPRLSCRSLFGVAVDIRFLAWQEVPGAAQESWDVEVPGRITSRAQTVKLVPRRWGRGGSTRPESGGSPRD